jgi:predicted phosphoadenosine phosphosulfate sulfurtransferase
VASLKRPLGINVLDAARGRVTWAFDTFPKIYVSFSGGKDSTAMLHLVADEAIRRERRFGVLFIDLEGQYKMTIDHVREMYTLYADHIDPFWVCLPLHLRNAVSQFQPHWICWDRSAEKDWIRPLPPESISDESFFPFFRHGMEFEEFIEYFGGWYGQGQPTACLVGIRSDESLNRFRALAMDRSSKFRGRCYTTWKGGSVFNVYPIYDWRTADDWIYFGKTGKPYNHLYDYMYKAGLTIHQMRICQPYGDDQRKGLWLFHLIEPETWGRVVARVAGANHGAIYIQESSNMLGNIKITKPAGHTWESFSNLLLGTMPEKTAEHFKNKIAVFLQWYRVRGYPRGIPDGGPLEKGAPNWKRICKALLRNDYWCKGLSFSQHKSAAYEKYVKVMKNRRQRWGIFPTG